VLSGVVRRMRPKHRDERGVTMVLFALTIVVLLIMVAFATDLGSVTENRRQAQNASDAAALAGAREIGLQQNAAGISNAVAAAKTYALKNFGIPLSAWNSCTDATPLSFTPSGSTPCISFNSGSGPTEIRVKLPNATVNYAFARVVGLNGADVTAFAHAGVLSPFGGYLLPVGVVTGSAGLQCIEGGGGSPGGSQCKLASGNFGSLTSPRYRTFTYAGDKANFAVGIDHLLNVWPGSGNYCDTNNNGNRNKCQSQTGGDWNNANSVYDSATWAWSDQGNQLQDPTDGLFGDKTTGTFIDGGITFKARLKRPDGSDPTVANPSGSPATPTITSSDVGTFNGVHISKYMTTSLGVTKKSAFYGGTDPAVVNLDQGAWDNGNEPQTGNCSSNPNNLSCYLRSSANVASGPIFSADILKSPRFGFVPMLESVPTGSSGPAKIVDILAVYLDRVGFNASGKVKGFRAFVFDPMFIEALPGIPGKGQQYQGGPFIVSLIK